MLNAARNLIPPRPPRAGSGDRTRSAKLGCRPAGWGCPAEDSMSKPSQTARCRLDRKPQQLQPFDLAILPDQVSDNQGEKERELRVIVQDRRKFCHLLPPNGQRCRCAPSLDRDRKTELCVPPSGGQFLQTPSNRAGSDPRGARHRRATAIPRRLGFRRRKDTPSSLVQVLGQVGIALANRGDVDHRQAIPTSTTYGNCPPRYPIRLFTAGTIPRKRR